MMEEFLPFIGATAAVLTSLSYIPQVRKSLPRGSTDDVSMKMLIALTAGLVLWVVYGALRQDWIIVAANGVGASLSGGVLALKLRNLFDW